MDSCLVTKIISDRARYFPAKMKPLADLEEPHTVVVARVKRFEQALARNSIIKINNLYLITGFMNIF